MLDVTDKISAALDRLNHILPLEASQQSLPKPLQDLHKAILRSYVDLGRSLTRDEITRRVDDIDETVAILKEIDLVVFNDNGEPTGAYPFTMEEREHRVTVNGHTVHCMCALDALSVSPMFNLPTEISSCCQFTSEPIQIQQQGTNVNPEAKEIYFGINWGAVSSGITCADSLCTEMLFLKNRDIAVNWFNEAPEYREIFDLEEAIDFGARFFVPLIAD
ncbi:organomercurial lyase [Kaarinaea lacus]